MAYRTDLDNREFRLSNINSYLQFLKGSKRGDRIKNYEIIEYRSFMQKKRRSHECTGRCNFWGNFHGDLKARVSDGD